MLKMWYHTAMRVLGIIAEYNPFHNGHLYQLKKSVDMIKADFVVAIISGNFTQRGEAAIVSKWTRSKMAVESGIDLVLELPFVFACNNAEYFAKGAIEIFNRLGCITHLSFGSECGDLSLLKQAANLLSFETNDFKQSLKSNLDMGLSYPKARSEAVKDCLGEEIALHMANPNNILAIEYLKQLILTESDIIPVTVKRHMANYHDTSLDGDIASASAIRKALNSNTLNDASLKNFMPEKALNTLAKDLNLDNSKPYNFSLEELYYKNIVSKVLTTDTCDLAEIFSAGEGIENKLKEAIRTSNNLDELKDSLKTKRYTATRISRLLNHIFIGLTKSDFKDIIKNEEYYARILAFNKKGAKLLKHIKKQETAVIPCITNINKEIDSLKECQLLLSYDLLASDLYNYLMNKNIYNNSDQLQKPYINI